MHYYIYPKGGNGKNIAKQIERFCGQDTYSFIDDSESNLSLEAQVSEIKKKILNEEAKILLASPRNENALLSKVKNHEIEVVFDGLKYLGDIINKYFKVKYEKDRVLGIILNGSGVEQKHLGSIPMLLKERDFKIVYLLSDYSYWGEELENRIRKNGDEYIYCDFEMVRELSFFPFLISQFGVLETHRDVRSLILYPSMEQLASPIYCEREYSNVEALVYYSVDYINIHSKRTYALISKQQSFCGIFPDPAHRLICGGYPSVDNQVEKSKNLDFSRIRDTVVFVSAQVDDNYLNKIEKIIKLLLEKKLRVLFKTCIPHEDIYLPIERKFAERFRDSSNFIFYIEPRLTVDEMERSIAFVGTFSSMMYSLPCITKRPSILLYPSRECLDEYSIVNDTFYNDELHIRIFEDDNQDIMQIIDELSTSKTCQNEWARKIENYCQNTLYNYGHASEYLADWIVQWYDNRELVAN